MEPIVLTIQGQPPRKSNSRRIVRNRKTGRSMVIKSKEALAWLEGASWQIPADVRQRVGSPGRPLRIEFFIRYASRRPDLSSELIMDMLQENDVIKDDRYVFEKVEHKQIDKENPGVDIIITETEEHTLTPEQRHVILNDLAQVAHMLVAIQGPREDGSVLTHWSDGEWFAVLANGETTGYHYDYEGRQEGAPVLEPKRGEDNSGAKLRAEDVLQIRHLYDKGQSCREIGDMFEVTASNVRKIGKRQIWKHLPERDN